MAGLAIALVTALTLAGPAHAVTLVTPDGRAAQPYQRWAERLPVPTPNARVIVHGAACPGDADIPAAYRDSAVIYEVAACGVLGAGSARLYFDPRLMPLERNQRHTFTHELGHVFDHLVLKDGWARDKLADLFRHMPGWSSDPFLLTEWIADGYLACSLRARLTWRDVDWRTGRWDGPARYGYAPTPKAHRRVCAVLRLGELREAARSAYARWVARMRRCERIPSRTIASWERRERCLERRALR